MSLGLQLAMIMHHDHMMDPESADYYYTIAASPTSD